MFDPCFHKMQPQSCFSVFDFGERFFGKLHFFGWSRGPAADLLLCASVQFSHKVNQKSHVALKNDSRPFVKNDLCPKRIPGYYDQIDCVLKTIGSNGDTSTWGLENIHIYIASAHFPIAHRGIYFLTRNIPETPRGYLFLLRNILTFLRNINY